MSDQELNPMQMFVKEYESLCEKHGFQLEGVPQVAFDKNKFGVWEQDLVINLRVVPLQKRG